MLKIFNYGPNKYVVENEEGKIHMLSLDALKWNLKKVFGFTGEEVLSIMVVLSNQDFISVNLKKVA